MKLRETISWLMGTLQKNLFPRLEECWDNPVTEKERRLVWILEVVEVERYIARSAATQWLGRKLLERQTIARAFVAKAVYNHPFTRTTIEALNATPNLRRICGFEKRSDIPSEATFSRAFGEFARSGLGDRVHEVLVKQCVKPQLVGHISRDATAIEGREKPVKKPKKEKPAAAKRGRPRKGEVREPKEEKRLDRQRGQSVQEALQELPVHCDVGTKNNSKGHKESWIGYKLHADVNDCGFPIGVVLTAASLHDSQVAIPLMKMTSERVDYLYDLMDSAYDAKPICEVSRSLGHVPIIDKNGHGKDVVPMAPHEAARYKERSASERFNSRLKEEFGARNVMVRGAQKVRLHLMFGVIALFADQLLKLMN
jgi:hypothetical protein